MKPLIRKPTKEEAIKASSWPVWEKEQSTFPWSYTEAEQCLILEGRAAVTTDEGDFSFGQGDFVTFPKGLKCKWKVLSTIKKRYHFG